MEQINITLIGKNKAEAADYQQILAIIAAHLNAADAKKLRKKLEQNPQIIKKALTFL